MIGDLFDPQAELLINERLRPHWSQAGAIVFVTFRTIDSIPKDVLAQWDLEKTDWLMRKGWHCSDQWPETMPHLTDAQRAEFNQYFNRCKDICLDQCHGDCWLRLPAFSAIVADSLMHFDGVRYRMGDFVVMPNHVHLLAAFADAESMEAQFDSWLHYTAFRIHQANGGSGHFWQQEPFDHLVRSVEQYEYLRRYIADNPAKASLRTGEFVFRRCPD